MDANHQFLNGTSELAHLDGELVYPIFMGDYHGLVTGEGQLLLLPTGMHVFLPGRFGVGPDGPFVDANLDDEDTALVLGWGERLANPEVLGKIWDVIQGVVTVIPEPERYTHETTEILLIVREEN